MGMKRERKEQVSSLPAEKHVRLPTTVGRKHSSRWPKWAGVPGFKFQTIPPTVLSPVYPFCAWLQLGTEEMVTRPCSYESL